MRWSSYVSMATVLSTPSCEPGGEGVREETHDYPPLGQHSAQFNWVSGRTSESVCCCAPRSATQRILAADGPHRWRLSRWLRQAPVGTDQQRSVTR